MKSRKAFSLIEIIAGIIIMSIVMVVSLQSVAYMNHIHQENELRYLALNRLDSEISRLVMAYDKLGTTFIDDNGGSEKFYKEPVLSNSVIKNDAYGLLILSTGTDKKNYVQIKNIGTEINEIEDGDFVARLYWREAISGSDKNISLSLEYPYRVENSKSDFVQLWDYLETITLKTSTQ